MVALLVAVLALKVALALTLAGHPLLQPVGDLDTGEYWRLAQQVAGGGSAADGHAGPRVAAVHLLAGVRRRDHGR